MNWLNTFYRFILDNDKAIDQFIDELSTRDETDRLAATGVDDDDE